MRIKRKSIFDERHALARYLMPLCRTHRKLILGCAGVCLLAISVCVGWVFNQARITLAQQRARVAAQEFIPFQQVTRRPLDRPEIKFWQNVDDIRSVVSFQDSYFAATGGGLVQYSPDGHLMRNFTVLDGLTESNLTALAVFNSKLFIGTASQGLLSFDGERFDAYRWLDRDAGAVTTMLQDNGRLLIGTFAGGLIEFDGKRFNEIKAEKDHQRLRAVNVLAKYDARLYVGTFDDGLWSIEAGRWFHFRTADGLPSNRVVGVVASSGDLYVACDFGLAASMTGSLNETATAEQKRFRTIANLPSLTSLTNYKNVLLACKDNGELFAFDKEEIGHGQSAIRSIKWSGADKLSKAHLATIEDSLMVLSDRGVALSREDPSTWTRTPASMARFGQAGTGPALASNVISALALDAGGRLWVGNFRHGIDVLSGEGKPLIHLESVAVREVNFLLTEAYAGAPVTAATSQGFVQFDSGFRATSQTKADGLPSNSVMQVTASGPSSPSQTRQRHPDGLVLATSRGMSMGRPGNWHALTTVQGLPSDNIYTTLFFRHSLFVGTLGGLAQVDSGRIVRVFKDSNSRLTHNWITALCAVGDRLFVGTYGGGVFELAATNDLNGFSEETGKLVVNPNAMWSDGEMLFVGTLDGAWVLNLHSQKWTHLKDELPSATVLSVAGDQNLVYLGTTNGIARIKKEYLESL